MRAVSYLIAFLFLAGCGSSRSQVQLVADARQTAEVLSIATLTDVARETLNAALVDQVLAATQSIPGLQKPSHTQPEILADPAAYAKQAAAARQNPPPFKTADQPKPTASAPAILGPIGSHLVTWGAWAGTIGLALLVVAWFGVGATFFALPLILPIIRIAASTGTAGAIIGSALLYLVEYFWLVGLSIVLALIVMAYIHRKDIVGIYKRVRAMFGGNHAA